MGHDGGSTGLPMNENVIICIALIQNSIMLCISPVDILIDFVVAWQIFFYDSMYYIIVVHVLNQMCMVQV